MTRICCLFMSAKQETEMLIFFMRLKQHTNDHLWNRWEYFSWFGLRVVNSTNKVLSNHDTPEKTYKSLGSKVLNEIEGVLIAAMEPKLNKQGSRFSDAQQFEQEIDENIVESTHEDINIRDPARFGHIGWTWVKTADEAIARLASGRVRKASLDHDLTVRQTIGYSDRGKTGYDVVRWMEEHNVWPSEGVQVHSAKPTGRLRMEQALSKRFAVEPPSQARKKKPARITPDFLARAEVFCPAHQFTCRG